jgi:O-antigen ligase
VKAFLQSRPGSLDQNHLIKSLAGLAVLVGLAVLTGQTIANGNWLILAAGAVGLLALQWPVEVGLGLYAFLLPFEAVTALGDSASGPTANRLIGMMAAAALLGTGLLRKRISWPPLAAIWWGIFLCWGLITILWAQEPEFSTRVLPTVLGLTGLYFAAASWRISEKQFSLLVWLLIVGGALAGCFAIYQYYSGVMYTSFLGNSGRASLVVGEREANPNTLGMTLLLPFSLAVGEFFSAERKLEKTLGMVAGALIAYSVFLTMSRGSGLAMAVVLAIFVFRLGFNRRVMAAVSVVVVLMIAMPSAFFSRIMTMFSSGGAGRLEIWHVGFALLQRYGLFGVGLLNFPAAYNEFAGYAPRFEGFGRGAHNLYLNTIVELGVVGFALMVAAVGSHIWGLRKLRPSSKVLAGQVVALECACWGMLAAALFADVLWEKPFWMVWMISLMALRLRPAIHENKATAPVYYPHSPSVAPALSFQAGNPPVTRASREQTLSYFS